MATTELQRDPIPFAKAMLDESDDTDRFRAAVAICRKLNVSLKAKIKPMRRYGKVVFWFVR